MFLPQLSFVFLLFSSISSISNGHDSDLDRKTLLISLDGFRYDYMDRLRKLIGDDRSNLWKLTRSSAYAPQGITSAFATMTFPNHYTMATGLYQETHGIISNTFYDPKENRSIDLTKDHDASIYGGEPIWKTMTKHSTKNKHSHVDEHEHDGMKSMGSSSAKSKSSSSNAVVACSMWVACQFGDFDQSHFVKYNESMPWTQRIDRALDWLEEESMKLVLVYYHEPDHTGHVAGPESKEMDEKLKEIDGLIGELIEKLEKRKMFDEINLIIAADHGMAENKAPANQPVLPTADGRPKDMFRIWSEEPTLWLVDPLPGRHDDTVAWFKKFTHLSVIEKPAISEKWHYKNNDRIPPIMILAEPGYALSFNMTGMHGYDNELKSMRPVFIGHGPAFVPNSVVPTDMGTVDVYLLLCTILDLTPASNNGSAVYFQSFVQPPYLLSTEGFVRRLSIVTLAIIVSVSVFASATFICHRRRVSAHKKRLGAHLAENNGYLYKPLPLESVGPLLTTSVDAGEDSDELFDEREYRKK